MEHTNPTRILYIEDDAGLARLCQKRLERSGCRVNLARTGEEGLAMLRDGPFDLLVVDQSLPGCDGLEVIRRLAHEDAPPPVIMLTGHGNEQVAVKAMKLGARDYIVKDADSGFLELLPAVINRVRQEQRMLAEKQAVETALRNSEARYRNTFEHAAVGIANTALDGRFLNVNRRLCGMVGYSRAELLGMKFQDITHPDDREANLAVLRKLLDNRVGASTLEKRYLHRNGSTVWVRLTVSLQRDARDRPEHYIAVVEDITARKQAEDALKAAQARYARAEAIAHLGSWETDLATGQTYWSDELYRIFGFQPAAFRPDWNISLEVVHPDDRPGLEEAVKQAVADGQPFTREIRAVRPDGSVRYVLVQGEYTFDDNQQPVKLGGSALDITARIQAERELRRRNRELILLNRIIAASAAGPEPAEILDLACRELAQAFEVSHAMATLISEDKTEVYVVAEYLGREDTGPDWPSLLNRTIPLAQSPILQQLLKQKAPMVITNTQTDPRLAHLRELVQQRGTDSMLVLPLVSGQEVLGSIALGAVGRRRFSAEEVSLVWNVADQLAGVLAHTRLAQAHRLLAAAIEQAGESVIITNAGDKIIYVNPAFERVSGYSRAEVLGRSPHLLDSDKHDEAFFAGIWSAISAGQVWRGQITNKKKDGSLYTEDAVITPIRDKTGRISHYVTVKRDITQTLELETQYYHAQKMEAMGRLTGGIVHDFNNLLTAINGFAELLLVRLPNNSPHRHLADKIMQSGRRAADLIGQLLAFSRKQVRETKVLNLNTVVTATAKLLRPVIGEHIRLVTNLPDNLWPVRVDPTQMEQVLVNLAVNARDAMPEGGVLTVETANVVLDDAYVARHVGVQPGRFVMLAVSDTGTGMSQAVKERIFEPFFTTKPEGKGTGLGLSTVFGIVRQNDGYIWVYSEEGQGTTFKIYLPCTDEPAQPADEQGRLEDLPKGSETVLVVEDDAGVRDFMCQVLAAQGYTTLPAETAEAALKLAADYGSPIHLLLTDVVLPGKNGNQLAAKLLQARPELKILFMSGYTDHALLQNRLLDKKSNFLQKPFSPTGLVKKIRAVLDTP